MLSALFAYAACLFDEGFADRVEPGRREKIASHTNWTEDANSANPLAATSIQQNNITVTFLAFAGGVLAGVGTLWILFTNGLLLGMVFECASGIASGTFLSSSPPTLTYYIFSLFMALFVSGGLARLQITNPYIGRIIRSPEAPTQSPRSRKFCIQRLSSSRLSLVRICAL